MSQNANDDFILYGPDYDALLGELQACLAQDPPDHSGILAAYGKLLAMRDKGFPLLVREGDVLPFGIRPANIHLLPPLEDCEERWLLATLVQEEEPKSWVQLLVWRTGKDGASVRPLAGQEPQPIAECRFRLDFRPSEIEFLCRNGFGALRLAFPLGELSLTFNANIGILSTVWQGRTDLSGKHIERYSWGDMDIAVRVERYPSRPKYWQDDRLSNAKNEALLPNSEETRLGRIYGADGPGKNKNLVYLASDRARVYRIDKSHPKDKPLQSQRRADEILDVLVIPWQGQETDHVILACVRNDALYLLYEDQNQLAVLHWHYTHSHIWRVIGKNDEHILSLDERGKLSPLRVVDPKEFRDLRRKTIAQLAGYYLFSRSGVMSWKRSQSMRWLKKDPRRFVCLGRLALEYFFSQLDMPDDSGRTQKFLEWSRWLNQLYGHEEISELYPVLADLHRNLIRHLTHWMAKCYFRKERNQPSSSIMDAIFELLTPNIKAPDIVWVPLLRKYDWVRLWAGKSGLLQDAAFRNRHLAWEQAIQKQRQEFQPGLSKIRPLNTLSSQRYAGPCRHVEILDSTTHCVAVLESTFGLRILRVPDTGEAWETLAELPTEDRGQPRWHAIPNFARKLPTAPGRPLRLLMGNSRGELFLLHWEAGKRQLTIKQKIEDCGFAMACCEVVAARNWVLLGGRNNLGRACLYGFHADDDNLRLKCLWEDKTKDKLYGSVYRLRASPDGTRLWGINRDRARLYAWDLVQHNLSQRLRDGILEEPKNWLDNVHKLFALDYSPEENLLVCGGDGGMAWALDADTGATRWVVNGSGNLRHVACLPDYPGKPAWLLCSDDQSSLLVNKQGDLLGVIEKAGPVSALAVSSKYLFLAIQNGRLIQFKINSPQKGPSWPQEMQAIYPLRGGFAEWPRQSLEAALKEPSLAGESLPAMRVLLAFANFLAREEVDKELERLFVDFFYAPQQTLERRIVFLYRLRDVCQPGGGIHPDAQAFALNELEHCFDEKTKQDSESGLLCKVISPILDTLNALSDSRHEGIAKRALDLRQKVNAWVWWISGERIQAIPAIRINQALKCWRKIYGDGPQDKPAQCLFDWCNGMAEELNAMAEKLVEELTEVCQNQDVDKLRLLLSRFHMPEELAKKLTAQRKLAAQDVDSLKLHLLRFHLSALCKSGLVLFAFENPWKGWLDYLVRDGKEPVLAPSPLASLEKPQGQPFSEDVVDDLAKAFPDNGAWKNWLDNLQTALRAVQSARSSSTPEAWRERSAWRGLREHIGRGERELFTVVEKQALLALWWPKLQQSWFALVDQSLQELERKVASNPSKYLEISWTDRWRSGGRVELTVALVNHFPGPLSVDQALWNDEPRTVAGLPLSLPPSSEVSRMVLNLDSAGQDTIKGGLSLRCMDVENGREIPGMRYPDITISRNLERFFDVPPWCGTGRRLSDLLTAYKDHEELFVWVDGTQWPEDERQNLKEGVRDKHGIALGPLFGNASEARLFTPCPDAPEKPCNRDSCVKHQAGGAVKPWEIDLPLFSPDLALDANPTAWLDQIHSLLMPLAGEFRPYLALALWRLAKGLPGGVEQALKTDLPSPGTAQNLLRRLFSDEDKVEQFRLALAQLPTRAVGAWCADEPFYSPEPGERYVPEELYLPPACYFDEKLWQAFDKASVPQEELQGFLGISNPGTARQQQTFRAIFRESSKDLFHAGSTGNIAHHEPLAQALLRRLGEGSFAYQKGIWCQETPITLNWQDYDRCYVLPKMTAVERARHKAKQPGLWLCLGENEPPEDLPGIALALDERAAWSLLHTERPVEAMILLNRLAAPQHSINPLRCFRDRPGLGEDLVGKHFGGREHDLKALWQCLRDADRGGSGCALLIGGRRMGKSSLRERIAWEVEHHTEEDERKRVIVYFNFEKFINDVNKLENASPVIQGYKLERWFFAKMRDALVGKGRKVDYVWRAELDTHPDERQRAREQVKRYLDKIKKETGHALLLVFDETEHLARADKEKSLFGFLRGLAQDGHLCLIATSYPYGADEKWALNVLVNDAREGNPFYNTFARIELGAWPPDTAWDYLQTRLSGFGVILPRFYRDRILQISRGIPWIIHAFGMAICKAFDPKEKSLKIVDVRIWRQAKKEVLAEIYKNLYTPVREVAEKADSTHGISANPEQRLGGGNLWQALCALAQLKAKTLEERLPIRAWPEPVSFEIAELEQCLPKAKAPTLREALRFLAASPAIEGIVTETDRYVFANHLLPMWLRYERGEAK